MGTNATVHFGVEPAPPFGTSTSSRNVVDQYGNRWLGKGFSSWRMSQSLTNTEITTALEAVAGLGFNAVQVAPCGVNISNAGKYTNAVGNPFFATANNGTTSTTAWTGFLGAAWSSMDWIVSESERLGITVIFSFFLSVVITNSGAANDMEASTNANMEAIGIKIANRYLSAPNLIWSVEADGDFLPGSTIGRRIDYVFKGIIATQTTPRLIFNEPGTDGTTYGQFIVDEGTDPTGFQWWRNSVNGMYSYGANAVELFDGVYAQDTSRPVWDSEPPYANAPHYGTGGSAVNRQNMRERNYSDFIRGAVAINYGDEDWWGFDDEGLYERTSFSWTQVPTVTESVQAGYAWDIVDAYMWDATWAPVSTLVTTGLGTGDTKAAQGASSTAAVAYFPSSRTVQVDTTIITGTANVRLRWYDPTAGTFTSITASEAQQTGRAVTYPSAHADTSNDWVLVVDLA